MNCHLTYVMSRGDVPYNYGEDGLDSYEDTTDTDLATGTGASFKEALEAALAALPKGLASLFAEFDSYDLDDETKAKEKALYQEAVDSLRSEGWEFQGWAFQKTIAKYNWGTTRWSIIFDEGDFNSPDWNALDCELVKDPTTVPSLLAALKGAA